MGKCIRCKAIEVGSIPQECSRCKSKNGLPSHRSVYVPPPPRARGPIMPQKKLKVFELDKATNIIENGFRQTHKTLKKM